MNCQILSSTATQVIRKYAVPVSEEEVLSVPEDDAPLLAIEDNAPLLAIEDNAPLLAIEDDAPLLAAEGPAPLLAIEDDLLSLDLETGWDFRVEFMCKIALEALLTLQMAWLVQSPPCTVFSDLQRLFNIKRITPEAWQARLAAGMQLLECSMLCARAQVDGGRFFAFEHPARASSWATEVVCGIASLESVSVVEFDMRPTRKRTKIMTNSAALAGALRGCYCRGDHTHACITGSEGGQTRARQRYPDGLVELIASIVR